ncbi:hypothetical protein [Anaerorhabdus sp.]|uniref:hypothetical protein n=1 Tax=Anaerorhabdus sp. TaxID=1872524 RepID=UPI002B205F62|nr:hypothetical protein [Anaerorhabdus sp.]MEA4875302.1 hypothetical protein [Anaerorhabdus sp.]
MNEGYVKLFRQMTAWEWYLDIPVKTLFIHLLLKANHSDRKYKGELIKRGQLVSSREKLAFETGLSDEQVKRSLKELERTNDITKQSSRKGTLITINNYNLYQDNNQQTPNETPSNEPIKQPQNNQQTPSNKNEKNIKKLKKYKLDDFIPLIHSFTSNEILREKITKFVEFRKSINKQLHVETFNEWLDELKGLSSDELIQIKIVSKSLANGWQGIFAITSTKQGGKKDVLPSYYADAKNGKTDNLDEKVTIEELNALQENLKSLGDMEE